MPTAEPSPAPLSDPPALLAIARAAHQIGDRDLERAARQLLRERYGIEVSFRRTTEPERRAADGTADTPAVRVVPAPNTTTAAGLTVREIARRYRVGEDKVRGWIRRGELRAINTAAMLCGKPRWVIPPEALAEFEKGRCGGPAPKPQRRPRRQALIDFYP